MKSWKEIRQDATVFSKRWALAYDEKSQAQSFLKEFFAVFGVDTVKFATFEQRVKLLDDSQGYIDLFWRGHILVEMKSKGKDLDKAFAQALAYTQTLPAADLPSAILVSDFGNFRFYDLSSGGHTPVCFRLTDLRKFVRLFGPVLGAEPADVPVEQDPVNLLAAERLAVLHDQLRAAGYTAQPGGDPLEILLMRLVFCLFAEDAEIFAPGQFTAFLKEHTAGDGSDLGANLAALFQTLDTPPEKRLSTLPESLSAFPYVDGGLFATALPLCAFTEEMRRTLLDASSLDWSKISPAIFGAMFQGVMDKDARRELGAHYTSEENILKLIGPLFLDGLRGELAAAKALSGPARKRALSAFHDRLSSLTFLDPACGCGNFLVIAYRELRALELDAIEALRADDPQQLLDVSPLLKVNVTQFYGIEIEPFPAEIARTALWLADHLCNLKVASRFGQYYARIPITASPHIQCANALSTPWPRTDYIMGNPPFSGASQMTAEQKAELVAVFKKGRLINSLDFVTCWFKMASDFIQGTETRCAFVATNGITHGEQVAPLWSRLKITILFAYRTFKWHNAAKYNAAVHCVIIGFCASGTTLDTRKFIFDEMGSPSATEHINAYLISAPDIIVESRASPVCAVPRLSSGNKPSDGGNFSLTTEERDAIAKTDVIAAKYIHPYMGSDEFINKIPRFCLWLQDAPPSDLRGSPEIMKRLEAVHNFRQASSAKPTREMANTPQRFFFVSQPKGDYIVIPRHSSEKRHYIPLGFLHADTIANDAVDVLPEVTVYHFAVLTSSAHNAWMRVVGGRLKSDYRYSPSLVYNTFVWPEVTDAQKAEIEAAGKAILDARAQFPGSTLADLYDPLTMPPALLKAHQRNDRLVLKAYGLAPDTPEPQVVARLFALYGQKR